MTFSIPSWLNNVGFLKRIRTEECSSDILYNSKLRTDTCSSWYVLRCHFNMLLEMVMFRSLFTTFQKNVCCYVWTIRLWLLSQWSATFKTTFSTKSAVDTHPWDGEMVLVWARHNLTVVVSYHYGMFISCSRSEEKVSEPLNYREKLDGRKCYRYRLYRREQQNHREYRFYWQNIWHIL